jgi:TatD DNase family protein
MIEYIDIHCHPNFPQYDTDRQEMLARMEAQNVYGICVGTDRETSRQSVDLANAQPNIYATIGVHPTEEGDFFDTEYFSGLARKGKVVAVGECGLDYFRRDADEAEKRRQESLFRKQVELSTLLKLPLMIHCRPSAGTLDAYEDILGILSEYREKGVRGNIHFFVGDVEIAKKFLNLGFTMSFTGVVTFARDYDEVIKFLPIERIMVETDSPFVAPLLFRGQRNEPLYVKEVLQKIAEIKSLDKEDVRKTIVETTKMVFGIGAEA